MLVAYWCNTFFLLPIMIYSHFKDKPHIMRFVHMVLIIRILMPFFNLEQRTYEIELADMIYFLIIQTLALLAMMIGSQISEPWYVHVPFTMVVYFFISFGQISYFYEKEHGDNVCDNVYQN